MRIHNTHMHGVAIMAQFENSFSFVCIVLNKANRSQMKTKSEFRKCLAGLLSSSSRKVFIRYTKQKKKWKKRRQSFVSHLSLFRLLFCCSVFCLVLSKYNNDYFMYESIVYGFPLKVKSGPRDSNQNTQKKKQIATLIKCWMKRFEKNGIHCWLKVHMLVNTKLKPIETVCLPCESVSNKYNNWRGS